MLIKILKWVASEHLMIALNVTFAMLGSLSTYGMVKNTAKIAKKLIRSVNHATHKLIQTKSNVLNATMAMESRMMGNLVNCARNLM